MTPQPTPEIPKCRACENSIFAPEVTDDLCDNCWLDKVELDNIAAFGSRHKII